MTYCETLVLFIMPTTRDCRFWPGCGGVFSYLESTKVRL